MSTAPDILTLAGPMDTILIGPRAAFGRTAFRALSSDEEVRRRLLRLVAEASGAATLRRAWSQWRFGGDQLWDATDRMLVDRVVAAARRGWLAVFQMPTTRYLAILKPSLEQTKLQLRLGKEQAEKATRPPPGLPASHQLSPSALAMIALRQQTPEGRVADLIERAEKYLVQPLRGYDGHLIDKLHLEQAVAVLMVWSQPYARSRRFDLEAAMQALGPWLSAAAAADASEYIRDALDRTLKATNPYEMDLAARDLARAVDLLGVSRFREMLNRAKERVALPAPVKSGRTKWHPPRRVERGPEVRPKDDPGEGLPNPSAQAGALRRAGSARSAFCEVCP